jgi:hypothetical protein
MSDGPYKSLPMKPRWRRVAKCVYQEAYSQDEIVECVTRASHADWRAEVRPSLLASVRAIVSGEGQQALFSDQIRGDLQVLQRSCASPMEASLVRNLVDAVQGGRFGNDAVQFAAEETLSDRLLCNYRQVEEHVRRDDSIANANFVRARFEAAHDRVDLALLAGAVLKTGAPLVRRARATFTGLDAGVPL